VASGRWLELVSWISAPPQQKQPPAPQPQQQPPANAAPPQQKQPPTPTEKKPQEKEKKPS